MGLVWVLLSLYLSALDLSVEDCAGWNPGKCLRLAQGWNLNWYVSSPYQSSSSSLPFYVLIHTFLFLELFFHLLTSVLVKLCHNLNVCLVIFLLGMTFRFHIYNWILLLDLWYSASCVTLLHKGITLQSVYLKLDLFNNSESVTCCNLVNY